ncbi:hypothetical protein C5B42_02530 [Candidatus Cerribacteria bacterium 'Amazon FNV 2010 28 9']|uniref:Uncharacterized protein n=1 Tax=Candidatus Cerribacteria bacterium 'Amazon FNV 2010 28 9' TaxID=2081795 RepID=A0A317JP04_9BACT|nr:MAG: hypothetical protein C5B42_02530 [Candidatus Cerribacteria bacterium 'Amazon FNV 2010 28 9']
MIELGKTDQVQGAKLEKLHLGAPLESFRRMPEVPDDKCIVCGYNRGLGEQLYICQSFDDMMTLYQGYKQGFALSIQWYTMPKPTVIMFIETKD